MFIVRRTTQLTIGTIILLELSCIFTQAFIGWFIIAVNNCSLIFRIPMDNSPIRQTLELGKLITNH